MKMNAIRSSETSVHKRSTRRHIPEDSLLQSPAVYFNIPTSHEDIAENKNSRAHPRCKPMKERALITTP
jgi:hypothetical protein